MNEYECISFRMWMSSVTHVNKSCHTSWRVMTHTHTWTTHIHVCHMSISHITHMSVPHRGMNQIHLMYEWVMSHVRISHSWEPNVIHRHIKKCVNLLCSEYQIWETNEIHTHTHLRTQWGSHVCVSQWGARKPNRSTHICKLNWNSLYTRTGTQTLNPQSLTLNPEI